jgi:hypothetical protein
MSLTKESLAARLTGRESGSEITRDEEAEAKAAGLIVLFGYSDDNLELRGAVHDEVGCYASRRPVTVVVTADGVVEGWDENKNEEDAREWFRREMLPRATVRVFYAIGASAFTWSYEVDVPHATFEIFDGDEKFCFGVVLAVADFKAPVQ